MCFAVLNLRRLAFDKSSKLFLKAKIYFHDKQQMLTKLNWDDELLLIHVAKLSTSKIDRIYSLATLNSSNN